MGLSAIVYKNRSSIVARHGEEIFDTDSATGETFVKDDSLNNIPAYEFISIEEFLGNVAEISLLNSTIKDLLYGRNSIILERILYSGSHSGDVIAMSDIEKLHDELQLLHNSDDSSVNVFVDKMLRLVSAARLENNPIAFV